VLNLAGRDVAVLPQQDLSEGLSTLLWNGRSKSGATAPAGSYLVRVTARSEGGGQSQALAGLSLVR
ncbi:MAG: FlgD immunoglobulin-like domain containing protein, partial [Armatimonadota bacterium]